MGYHLDTAPAIVLKAWDTLQIDQNPDALPEVQVVCFCFCFVFSQTQPHLQAVNNGLPVVTRGRVHWLVLDAWSASYMF